MIFHNNILCVVGSEIIRSKENPEGLVPKDLWDKWIKTGSHLVQRGGNGRVSLIEFDTIPPKYKALIAQKFGDPRKSAVKNGFLDMVVTDQAAADFFATYPLESGKHLPREHQHQYTANASVLNALRGIYTEQIAARSARGSNLWGLWDKNVERVNSVRETLGHKLPTSKSHLKRVYDQYIKEGYESLISEKFCNKNTEKITPEIEDWLVVEMATTRQSIEMVYMRYGQVAVERGWRTDIEASAFRHRISQPRIRQMIQLKQYGIKQFRKLNGQSFKLKKPTYSNDIWVSDGTAVNWYYREGNTVVLATTYMVMDACSKKFLGWSMRPGVKIDDKQEKENFGMHLEAYRMALRNSGAKPYQVLYDNQGGHKKKESRVFYSSLSKVHFPTRAYRPSGKPIEQAFGDFQRLKLSEFPFWSGFSRESHSTPRFRPDYENIQKNKDLLPNYQELCTLFDKIVQEWNELDFTGKGSPNQIYEASRNPEETPIALDELAELFWNMADERKYNAPGIILRLKNEDYLYEVYDRDGNVDYEFRRRYLHQRFFVKYDPDGEYKDVELYQVHPTGGYQKIATASPKKEVSRSVRYQDEGERSWIDTQMKLEGDMIEQMGEELTRAGYCEEIKWSSWRTRVDQKQPAMARDEDGDEDMYSAMLNRI